MQPMWQLFTKTAALLAILGPHPGLANNADGSCSKSAPCEQGCCGESGYCGFGPKYCGDGCVSGCDAQAECGQYAPTPGQKCPLNVCCSEFGFCGTTSEFCNDKCQSNCDKPKQPGCTATGGSANKRTIGYWESWSTTRPCDAWKISDIDATKWTHLNFAFALIDESNYGIAQMAASDIEQYSQLTSLKKDNPSLKVYISVGGWSAGGAVFSSMCASSANRAAFIRSLQTFMKTYAFDGVDIDWEYPVADDRGGSKADFDNFVTFLKELRAALGSSYGITATLPSSYWYLQGFDIAGMQPYLDWFNMMTYDIHGTWDGANKFTKKVVQAHTNLTEIDQAMDLLWRNGIDSNKVVLGLGFYGRAFTLEDPSCKEPGCPFAGGAKKGKCTGESGILSNSEIQDVISQNNIKPTLVKEDAIKYITWDTDQWVSYDDEETLKMKNDYANKLCLGGTMVWALDLDKPGSDKSIDSLIGAGIGDSKFVTLSSKRAVVRSNSLSLNMFWTPCLPKDTVSPCPKGYSMLVQGHGKVFDADLSHLTGEGCHGGGVKGFQRALCAATNIQYGNLMWGRGTNSKACNSKCPNGWVTISKNSHITGQKSGCKSGKYAPLCASSMSVQQHSDMCYATDSSYLFSGGFSLSPDLDDTFEFGLVGGPGGVLSKKRSFEDLQARKALRKRKRSIGSNYDCLPPGGIALDIPAVLSVRYADGYSYGSMVPTTIRISSSSTKLPPKTVTSYETTTTYSTQPRTCLGAKYPQACYHYSSVAVRQQLSMITCSNRDVSRELRPMVNTYNAGHKNKVWFAYIAKQYVNPDNKRKNLRPERDEWPPSHFQQGTPIGWIRLLPNDQNGPAANTNPRQNGWKGFCKFPPDRHIDPVQGGAVGGGIVTHIITTVITLNVMSYTWSDLRAPAIGDPEGLTANVCRPSVLTNDVGFAIMTDDPWYGIVRNDAYNKDPGSKTNGVQQPPTKRDADGSPVEMALVDGRMVVDNGNATRYASDEELMDSGLTKCTTPECEEELEALRLLREDSSRPSDALPNLTAHVGASVALSAEGRQPASTVPVPTGRPTEVYSRKSGHLRSHRSHYGRHGGH